MIMGSLFFLVFVILVSGISTHWIARFEPTRLAVVCTAVYAFSSAMFVVNIEPTTSAFASPDLPRIVLTVANIISIALGTMTGARYAYANYYGAGGWGGRLLLTFVAPFVGLGISWTIG